MPSAAEATALEAWQRNHPKPKRLVQDYAVELRQLKLDGYTQEQMVHWLRTVDINVSRQAISKVLRKFATAPQPVATPAQPIATAAQPIATTAQPNATASQLLCNQESVNDVPPQELGGTLKQRTRGVAERYMQEASPMAKLLNTKGRSA